MQNKKLLDIQTIAIKLAEWIQRTRLGSFVVNEHNVDSFQSTTVNGLIVIWKWMIRGGSDTINLNGHNWLLNYWAEGGFVIMIPAVMFPIKYTIRIEQSKILFRLIVVVVDEKLFSWFEKSRLKIDLLLLYNFNNFRTSNSIFLKI